MWVFTKSGFFSAVRHTEKPDVLLVRARFEGDLERFCRTHGLHGIKKTIRETPDADYRFRAEIPCEAFAEALRAEALTIDYPNFKSAVHDGTERDAAYMDCWSAMRRGQDLANKPKRWRARP